MPEEVELTTPLSRDDVLSLKIGDIVYLNGVVFTSRDLAHQRIVEHLERGEGTGRRPEEGSCIPCGPSGKEEEWRLGGHSHRAHIEHQDGALLGGHPREAGGEGDHREGGMGEGTLSALKRDSGVYLLSPPGCAVTQGKALRKVLRVHWLDLGIPEAMWVLEAEDWGPLIVSMDSKGESIFKRVRERALKRISELFYEGSDG